MSQTRNARLDRLVELHGDEAVRRIYASASEERLADVLADAERDRASSDGRSRLAADWDEGRFRIVGAAE